MSVGMSRLISPFKIQAPLSSHHEIFPDYPISLINPGAELQLNFDNVVIVFEIPTDFNIVKGFLFPHLHKMTKREDWKPQPLVAFFESHGQSSRSPDFMFIDQNFENSEKPDFAVKAF